MNSNSNDINNTNNINYSEIDSGFVVCVLVEQMPVPPVRCTLRKCKRCGRAIWLSLSTPKRSDHIYVCSDCGFSKIREDRDVVIEPFTKEQVIDINRILKKEDN